MREPRACPRAQEAKGHPSSSKNAPLLQARHRTLHCHSDKTSVSTVVSPQRAQQTRLKNRFMERCRGFFGGQSACNKRVRGFNASDVTATFHFQKASESCASCNCFSYFRGWGVCVSFREECGAGSREAYPPAEVGSGSGTLAVQGALALQSLNLHKLRMCRLLPCCPFPRKCCLGSHPYPERRDCLGPCGWLGSLGSDGENPVALSFPQAHGGSPASQ